MCISHRVLNQPVKRPNVPPDEFVSSLHHLFAAWMRPLGPPSSPFRSSCCTPPYAQLGGFQSPHGDIQDIRQLCHTCSVLQRLSTFDGHVKLDFKKKSISFQDPLRRCRRCHRQLLWCPLLCLCLRRLLQREGARIQELPIALLLKSQVRLLVSWLLDAEGGRFGFHVFICCWRACADSSAEPHWLNAAVVAVHSLCVAMRPPQPSVVK